MLELNSIMGTVFYWTECIIIGVLLRMGLRAQSFLKSESLSKIVAQLKLGRVLLLISLRSFFSLLLFAYLSCSNQIVKNMYILSHFIKNTYCLRLYEGKCLLL